MNGAMHGGRSIFRATRRARRSAGMAVALRLLTLVAAVLSASPGVPHPRRWCRGAGGGRCRRMRGLNPVAEFSGGRARGRCRRAVTHASGGHCVAGPASSPSCAFRRRRSWAASPCRPQRRMAPKARDAFSPEGLRGGWRRWQRWLPPARGEHNGAVR
ncbi:MAG: hypothetical protein ACLTDR_04815 [Adlercreutzia equolifaciens]